MKKKGLGKNWIGLRELIPDTLNEGINLHVRGDFLLLGKDNLNRFISHWRQQEREAQKEVDRWVKVLEVLRTGTYERCWIADGISSNAPAHCCNCRYGVYYSDYDKSGDEFTAFVCAQQVDMEYFKPFSSTPIGVERNAGCLLAAAEGRAKRVMLKKARNSFWQAKRRKDRIPDKIDILERMRNQAPDGVPMLPALRSVSDFPNGTELRKIIKEEKLGGKPTLQFWYADKITEGDKRVPAHSFANERESRSCIHPQDALIAKRTDAQYMWEHRKFAQIWISSIRNENARSMWQYVLIDTATPREEEVR